jgi:NDP-sugar pyrophosphorylase family protein
VILAGGLATRMYPLTRDLPKFLLPVAGEPFAHHLLRRLSEAGFSRVVLCIGHLGEMIQDALGDGAAFGLRVSYSDEGEARLGTAGALRNALPALESAFLVTYGDSYLPFDYRAPLADLLAHPEALGTMAVYRNEDQLDASNCEVSQHLVLRYEKRRVHDERDPALTHIDYGAIALRREVIAALPPGPYDLAIIQRDLAAQGRLRAHHAKTRFYEIGSAEGYRDLDALLSSPEVFR